MIKLYNKFIKSFLAPTCGIYFVIYFPVEFFILNEKTINALSIRKQVITLFIYAEN